MSGKQSMAKGLLIAIVWALYLITHYVQRFRPLRYVIEFTSLSRFGYWRTYIPPLYKKGRI